MTDLTPAPTIPSALTALDDAGVAWCVWKGTNSIPQSLRGDGDLDVVVDPARAGLAADVLRAHGFHRAQSTRAHPHVTDWFGTNVDDGALIHLQCYSRIVIDDSWVTRWILPGAEEVLARRVRTPEGLWRATRTDEIALVTFQAVARPEGLHRAISRRHTVTPAALTRRLAPLVAEVSAAEVAATAQRWLPVEAASRLARVADGHGGDRAYEQLRRDVTAAFAHHRVGRARTLVSTLKTTVAKAATAVLGRRDRSLPGGGLIVAVIGSDGSGKSSLVADLSREYRRKFDTQMIYFGSGDGPAAVLFVPFKLVRRVIWRIRPPEPSGDGAAPPTGTTDADPAPGALKAVWALGLAAEKRQKARIAARARRRGALVICDRFPQVQFPGIHDGPRLQAWADHASPLRRALARWELGHYERALEIGPDLTLRLLVSPEVARGRRPEHDPDDLDRRIEVVEHLELPGRMIDLDADAPLEDVRRAARAAVFQAAT